LSRCWLFIVDVAHSLPFLVSLIGKNMPYWLICFVYLRENQPLGEKLRNLNDSKIRGDNLQSCGS
jgi:hypothetical protein